ncbi:MAG: hypothetical protein ACRDYF_02390 [Acidimicrobiia bacterium]
MPTIEIHIAGAGGGQGTTTIATALAALASRTQATTLIAVRPKDVCALAGATAIPDELTPLPLAPNLTLGALTEIQAAVTVIDAGRIDQPFDTGDPAPGTLRWLVVRGPCYLSLRTALDSAWPAEGVIVVTEPGRALRAADVADVLGLPVVAQVTAEPRLGRAIDAGLLLPHLERLGALRPLQDLLERRCPTAPPADLGAPDVESTGRPPITGRPVHAAAPASPAPAPVPTATPPDLPPSTPPDPLATTAQPLTAQPFNTTPPPPSNPLPQPPFRPSQTMQLPHLRKLPHLGAVIGRFVGASSPRSWRPGSRCHGRGWSPTESSPL